jgi:hypothetical protein
MNFFLSKRRNILALSLSLFIAGAILFNGTVDYAIVSFINKLFSTHFNIEFRAFGIGYFSTILVYLGAVSLTWFFYISVRIRKTHFYFLSIFLLILHYCYYVITNAINYPIYDDQGAIMEFFNLYTSQSAFKGKLDAILLPYNEAWMLVPKLILLAFWKLSGEINFSFLMIFNAVFLDITFLLLILKNMKEKQIKYFWVTAFLLFQLQSFNTIFIGISGLCYYWVVVFSFSSLYFLTQQGRSSKILSLLFAMAATLTFGNGLLLFPIAIAYLLSKRQWRYAFAWFITLSALFYFLSGTFAKIQFAGEFTMNPSYWILFIPTLLGSSFQFFYSVHIPVLVGCSVIFIVALGLNKKWHKTSPVIFLMLTFMILSAASAAPFRSAIRAGGYYGLEVRYGFFSIVAVILALVLLIENTNLFKVRWKVLLTAAFAYNILTGIFFYPEVPVRTLALRELVTSAHKKEFSLDYSAYRKVPFNNLMGAAMDKGIYKP